MQKTILNKPLIVIDIDTVNLRKGFYIIENKKVCIFWGLFRFIFFVTKCKGNAEVALRV